MDEAEELPTLRTTSWAVLGLLSFGSELSGYDLKKWADYSLRFFYWAPSFSQIYAELRKLEVLGYATSRVVTKDAVRGKRLYTITEQGMQAMTRWAVEIPPEPVVLKHGIMLRVWLGHVGELEALRGLLEEHQEQSERMRRRARADAEGGAAEPGWAFSGLVLKWAEDYYASERDRIGRMLRALDEVAEIVARSTPRPPSSDQIRNREI